MPEENPAPKLSDAPRTRTVEERLAAIEEILAHIRALLEREAGSGRLGHD